MPHKVSDRPPDMIDHRTLDDIWPQRLNQAYFCHKTMQDYVRSLFWIYFFIWSSLWHGMIHLSVIIQLTGIVIIISCLRLRSEVRNLYRCTHTLWETLTTIDNGMTSQMSLWHHKRCHHGSAQQQVNKHFAVRKFRWNLRVPLQIWTNSLANAGKWGLFKQVHGVVMTWWASWRDVEFVP